MAVGLIGARNQGILKKMATDLLQVTDNFDHITEITESIWAVMVVVVIIWYWIYNYLCNQCLSPQTL